MPGSDTIKDPSLIVESEHTHPARETQIQLLKLQKLPSKRFSAMGISPSSEVENVDDMKDESEFEFPKGENAIYWFQNFVLSGKL